MRRQIADITDEGLRLAHASQNGLYQHCDKLYINMFFIRYKGRLTRPY